MKSKIVLECEKAIAGLTLLLFFAILPSPLAAIDCQICANNNGPDIVSECTDSCKNIIITNDSAARLSVVLGSKSKVINKMESIQTIVNEDDSDFKLKVSCKNCVRRNKAKDLILINQIMKDLDLISGATNNNLDTLHLQINGPTKSPTFIKNSDISINYLVKNVRACVRNNWHEPIRIMVDKLGWSKEISAGKYTCVDRAVEKKHIQNNSYKLRAICPGCEKNKEIYNDYVSVTNNYFVVQDSTDGTNKATLTATEELVESEISNPDQDQKDLSSTANDSDLSAEKEENPANKMDVNLHFHSAF